MLCEPVFLTVFERPFWYRAEQVRAVLSREEGLLAGTHVVPFENLVSVTNTSSTTLQSSSASTSSSIELELRCFAEGNQLVALLLIFANKDDFMSWSRPLVQALQAPIFNVVPKDIFPLITAYLQVSSWKALRLVSNAMKVVADKEKDRIESLIEGLFLL
jgi:hypothetical protein